MDPTIILSAFEQLRQWLSDWRASRKSRSEEEKYALSVLLHALTETHVYLGDLDIRSNSGKKINPEEERKKEKELARAWGEAAAAFMNINKEVAPLLQLKSEAWARPMLWSDRRIRKEKITIEDMSELARQLLADERPDA